MSFTFLSVLRQKPEEVICPSQWPYDLSSSATPEDWGLRCGPQHSPPVLLLLCSGCPTPASAHWGGSRREDKEQKLWHRPLSHQRPTEPHSAHWKARW